MIPWVRLEYEGMVKEPKVRDTLLLVLGQCYHQKGPIWAKKKILKGSDKPLADAAQKAFGAAGYDKQSAKGLAGAFRKCCGAEKREVDARVPLNLPEEVVAAMGDLDSKTWKKRKEAMEKIAAECDGLDVKMSDGVMAIAKALSECLADKNVANKPVAATTLQVSVWHGGHGGHGGVLGIQVVAALPASLDPSLASAHRSCVRPFGATSN